MQKWEYMKIAVKWDYSSSSWQFEYEDKPYPVMDLISVMNTLGQQGWEHTVVVPFYIAVHNLDAGMPPVEKSTNEYDLFFKRSVP